MQVFTELESLPSELAGAVVGLGNFDGVHIAHQEIIKTCVTAARQHNKKSIIITFDPHPSIVLRPELHHKNIISHEAKLAIFAELGVEYVYTIPFTNTFAEMSAEKFISTILYQKLKVSKVITGYNFFFGHERKGDANLLYQASKYYNFVYQLIDKISYNYHDVSSSNIKKLMKCGALGIVNAILGRKYNIKGVVQQGDKRGRTIEFPTANLKWDETLNAPALGVYLTQVILDGRSYYGIANIGKRPTFHDGNDILLEVHIFDFAQEIYNQYIDVQLLHFIRPERRFSSPEKLQQQLKSDISVGQYIIPHLRLNNTMSDE